jgi:hypothetical protein
MSCPPSRRAPPPAYRSGRRGRRWAGLQAPMLPWPLPSFASPAGRPSPLSRTLKDLQRAASYCAHNTHIKVHTRRSPPTRTRTRRQVAPWRGTPGTRSRPHAAAAVGLRLTRRAAPTSTGVCVRGLVAAVGEARGLRRRRQGLGSAARGNPRIFGFTASTFGSGCGRPRGPGRPHLCPAPVWIDYLERRPSAPTACIARSCVRGACAAFRARRTSWPTAACGLAAAPRVASARVPPPWRFARL